MRTVPVRARDSRTAGHAGGTLKAPSLDDVTRARDRISGAVLRTPLVRYDAALEPPEIFLKLESLQPIGSFKLRGALNFLRSVPPAACADGIYTASAGNMAQGVAWAAREIGVPASVVVPDTAPRAKVDAIERLGATVVCVPYAEWWSTMQRHGREGMRGLFVHPFADPAVMAGNGTIALEMLEDVPELDAIIVPWGGGGLACGIAAAAHAIDERIRVYACEVEHAAPLAVSRAAGEPREIENRRTFVDGIGGRSVFPEMWPLAQRFIADSLVVPVEHVADAVRLLAGRGRVVAEGAGAVSLAAAIMFAGVLRPAPRRVACVVSGGNIDAAALATILSGSIP